MARKPNGVKVSPEEFVAAWQKAGSVSEVAEATGLALGAVRSRVVVYRKHGVPLKAMPRGRRAGGANLDWAALVKHAKGLLQKD